MFDSDWSDDDQLQAKIQAESQKRRSDPLAGLATFLQDFWTENTEEEVRQMWKHRASTAPQFAEDMLYCLDAVIRNPPAELEQFIREEGGVFLYHDDGTATLYSDAEALDWLRRIAREFRLLAKKGRK